MVIEAGIVTGYVIAWAIRKARRVAGGLDCEVDAALDEGLEKLHAVVAAKLSGHPALEDLAEEVADVEATVSELTRQQVELAVTAAARRDKDFSVTITELVAQVRAAEKTAGVSVVAGTDSRVFIGNSRVEARDGGIAFGPVGGDVRVERADADNELPGPTRPGRSRP